MSPLIEILVVEADRDRRFVAARNEPITLGRNGDCQVVLDESSVGTCQASLEWTSDHELTLNSPSPATEWAKRGGLLLGGESVILPAIVREGSEVPLGPATLTWRRLPPAEWPTLANGTAPSSAAEKLAGELGRERYDFGEEVGRGGMGKVLQATEKPLQRSIALKRLLRPGNKEDQERFIREARITEPSNIPASSPCMS